MSFMEIKNLKVHYPLRGGFLNRVVDTVKAVDDISMEFEEGKTYGLVGESGCGKSTTGRAIIGLEKITEGSILYEGADVTNQRRKRKSVYNRDIQMIFQDAHSSMNPKKRVKDILAEPIRNFMNLSPQEEKKRISELLNIVGMNDDVLLKYPHEFSGGQKQRLGIARAVACNPKLIIADEPVSALDLSVQAQVLNFMRDIQEQFGLTFLFISHDLGVVKHMCDYIHVMYRGRIVESGTREDIYHNAKHIYTNRLLSAIPRTEPTTRDDRKIIRQNVEEEYRLQQYRYFDENGLAFPLTDISSSHKVALAIDQQGGE